MKVPPQGDLIRYKCSLDIDSMYQDRIISYLVTPLLIYSNATRQMIVRVALGPHNASNTYTKLAHFIRPGYIIMLAIVDRSIIMLVWFPSIPTLRLFVDWPS